jgi:hypothetical protein
MSASNHISSRSRMIFLRGLIWSLIGLIYAPLFTGLQVSFDYLGLGHAASIPAAALSGAVGAAFYGARVVAIAGTAVGVVVASLVLLALPGIIPLWQVVLPAAAVGAALGGIVRFSDHCSLKVPGKTLAGLVTGAACGSLLAFAEPLHADEFHITGTLAFLVAVNGVLYVATVRWWVGISGINRGQVCNLVESLVIAVLAATTAGAIWAVAGPLLGAVDYTTRTVLGVVHQQIPPGMLGALLGGAVAGALLEAFDFRWVHDT